MDIQAIFDNPKMMDVLVSRIAEEVLRRLKNQPKTALVIFSGAAIGFKQELEAMEKLKNDGWKLKVFLSDAAMDIFTPDLIMEKLGVEEIYHSKVSYSQRDLYQNVDKIIIAATTVNTAAKIAYGICDNDLLTLVNHGIMAGTPILCCVNGACPDNQERAKLGMGKSPEGYRQLLKNHFRAMISYGIELCTSEDLYEKSIGTAKAVTPKAEPAKVASQKPARKESALRIDKHVISNLDIRTARAKVIEIPQDALVTQSAADTARDLGITIRRN